MRLPIFPLSTVLFPGGVLPLRIFEARYMDMARDCLRDELSFGVCRITDPKAREISREARVAEVGCSASIAAWDMRAARPAARPCDRRTPVPHRRFRD